MMELPSSLTIRGLFLVLMLAMIFKFSDAIAQNGNIYGTCIGNGGFDDSCPTGMYCNSNIGGTCFNCSTCYQTTFFGKLIPLKCQCDSVFTGSSAICVSIPANEQIGDPIESEEDVNSLIPNATFNDFKGYFDGSAARGMPCPAEPTTSSPELTTYDQQLTPYLQTPPVQDHPEHNDSSETGSPEQCMDPVDPVNGFKKSSNLTKGATIEFACNKGYALEGKKLIYCMEDGNWSDEIPTCSKVQEPFSCKDPGSPISGFQIQKDYHLHGIVTFACNRAYRLEGPNRIQCTDLGWSDSVPQCIKSWKGKWVWIIPLLLSACVVLFLVVFAAWCCRHKFHDVSIYCTPGQRSDVENPTSNERSCGTGEDPSENYHMLPESSSEGSSSSSGTRSGSVTPEHTSALDLTDEDSTKDTLASTSIQHTIRMDSVCSSSMKPCSEKLTEVAWTAMESALQTLLGNVEFRKAFLRQLFSENSLSEHKLDIVCSQRPDKHLIQAVKEDMEIYEVDSFVTMGRTLSDSSLRSEYPVQGEKMEELIQLLSGAHQKCCNKCNESIQQPSDYSTAV